jgi:predicted membrane-bound mannosyltransferase
MAIAVAAVVLRLYDLELKPLHHDEGVNGHFLRLLVEPPHVYRYDPKNCCSLPTGRDSV